MHKRNNREPREQRDNDEIIYGRNAVSEAIKAGVSINKILYYAEATGSIVPIIKAAKDAKIILATADRNKLNEIAGTKDHQGIVAYVSPKEYVTIDDILKIAEDKGETPFIIIMDEVQDPHNLGAVLRTCDAVGAHGVVISKRRGAPLTGTVAKASAGALEHVPVARATNITATIKELKDKGLWIYGTDMDGETNFFDVDLKGPVALVIGSEGFGMGRLVKENCDFILNIPMQGKVSSLNASVAAGVVMYEIFRQRRK